MADNTSSNNSTSRMMQRLMGGEKSSRPSSILIEESIEEAEPNKKILSYTPQPDMEQILKNSFADSYSKDHSPME